MAFVKNGYEYEYKDSLSEETICSKKFIDTSCESHKSQMTYTSEMFRKLHDRGGVLMTGISFFYLLII